MLGLVGTDDVAASNSDGSCSRSRCLAATRARSVDSERLAGTRVASYIVRQTINKTEEDTYVIIVPCPTFSFKSDEVLPLLRFDHPRAFRLAVDPTRGRALGARPKAFSRLGSGFATSGDRGFTWFNADTAEMLWLIGSCCRTGLSTRRVFTAETLTGCIFKFSGERGAIFMDRARYGEGRDCVRERI